MGASQPEPYCVRANNVVCYHQAAYLLRNDGLFVGSSAAMNCVGAVKLARNLGPGHTIATILCDGGHRYVCACLAYVLLYKPMICTHVWLPPM